MLVAGVVAEEDAGLGVLEEEEESEDAEESEAGEAVPDEEEAASRSRAGWRFVVVDLSAERDLMYSGYSSWISERDMESRSSK